MSLADLLKRKRNIAASIAIALSCGIACSLSASAGQPVSPTKPGDGLKRDAASAETMPHSDVKPAATSGVGAGVESGIGVDGVGGVKSGTKADAANGAKPDVTNPESSTKGDITNKANDEVKKGTESGATESAVSTAAPVIKGSEAAVTPLENSAEDEAVEEDPYAQYNKQQMALFQQHEAVQHYNAAKYYMKNWDNELAELELRAAIMYMPNLRIAHRDYCIVAICRGKLLRALAEFCMVFGIGEPLALTEEQQAALRTEASQGHYKKGLELATKGNWNEAISELMWARTYLPNDPAVHRSLAFAYASKGDFKLAEQYYQSTFSIDPNDAFAHADFAFLLSKKGKVNEAVSEMAKAVKADPDSTALHVDLGWLAESKGDLQKAEAEFRAALNRAPQYAQLWYHLGQILERRKRPGDALVAYKTAIEKEPSNLQAKQALTRLGAPAATPIKPPDREGAVTPIKPENQASVKTVSPAATATGVETTPAGKTASKSSLPNTETTPIKAVSPPAVNSSATK